MNETFVIDGTNVCWWYSQSNPEEMSISPLIAILAALLENGDNFYCVFDAPTTLVLKKQGKGAEAEYFENLLSQYPKRFYRVTGSTRADGVILHYADHNNCRIISNDIFRDYRDKYTWLEDRYSHRLIQGNLQPGGLLTLDKLAYGHLSLPSDNYSLISLFENFMRGNTGETSFEKDDSKSSKNKDLDNDQSHIAEVQKALSIFLEPYDTNLPFYGSSWDVAVKRMEIFFERHKICTSCYCINYNSEYGCSKCEREALTNNPLQIWEIIDKYTPEDKKKIRHTSENPIESIEDSLIAYFKFVFLLFKSIAILIKYFFKGIIIFYNFIRR